MQRLRGLLGLSGGSSSSSGVSDAGPHRKRSTDVDEAVSELAALVPNATVSSARVRTPRAPAGSRLGATTADAPAGGPVTRLTVRQGAGCWCLPLAAFALRVQKLAEAASLKPHAARVGQQNAVQRQLACSLHAREQARPTAGECVQRSVRRLLAHRLPCARSLPTCLPLLPKPPQLAVTGMHCSACSSAVEAALRWVAAHWFG